VANFQSNQAFNTKISDTTKPETIKLKFKKGMFTCALLFLSEVQWLTKDLFVWMSASAIVSKKKTKSN